MEISSGDAKSKFFVPRRVVADLLVGFKDLVGTPLVVDAQVDIGLGFKKVLELGRFESNLEEAVLICDRHAESIVENQVLVEGRYHEAHKRSPGFFFFDAARHSPGIRITRGPCHGFSANRIRTMIWVPGPNPFPPCTSRGPFG